MTEDQLNRIEERTANFTKNGTHCDVSWFAGYAEECIPTLIAEVKRLQELIWDVWLDYINESPERLECRFCGSECKRRPGVLKLECAHKNCPVFSPDGKLK